MSIFDGLNIYQKEAVAFKDGKAIVIAGAGAGKTRSIVARIVNLISQDVDPSTIFASTFTKKAAEEMKNRVKATIGDDGEYVRISTMHSFCYQVLKKWYTKYANHKKITMVNDGIIWMQLSNLIKENNLKLKRIDDILSSISRYKLSAIGPEEFYETIIPPEKKADDYVGNITNDEEICFYFVYKWYDRFLAKNDWVDFSDMLFKVHKIFNNPEYEPFVNIIRKHINYIIVDEAQDMNQISYDIYAILAKGKDNIMLVGDLRQAIYSFQGANHNLMLSLINSNEWKLLELPTNYRSTKNIVDHSNHLISNSFFLKSLTPAIPYRQELGEIEVLTSEDSLNEAQNVAELIITLINKGHKPSDIAVLYRIHSLSMELLDECILRKIPYYVHSSYNFFNKKEIRVILNYLKAVAQPHTMNREDFWDLANVPVRYIKKITFNEIEDGYDSGMTDSFFESLLGFEELRDDRQKRCVENLVDDIRKFTKFCKRNTPTTREAIEYILDDLGVQKWFETVDGQNSELNQSSGEDDREFNTETLMSLADKYKHITDFIAFADGMRTKKHDKKDEKSGVQFMTCHKSKGLEFPIVIILGVSNRTMPFHRAEGLEGIDEERRLMYVAVTRAEDQLYVSTVHGKQGRFNAQRSMFLEELQL